MATCLLARLRGSPGAWLAEGRRRLRRLRRESAEGLLGQLSRRLRPRLRECSAMTPRAIRVSNKPMPFVRRNERILWPLAWVVLMAAIVGSSITGPRWLTYALIVVAIAD